jgi:hypothetical protein
MDCRYAHHICRTRLEWRVIDCCQVQLNADGSLIEEDYTKLRVKEITKRSVDSLS